MKQPLLQTLALAVAWLQLPTLVIGFAREPSQTRTRCGRAVPNETRTRIALKEGRNEDALDGQARRELSDRLQTLNRELLEQEWARPPNVNCSPEELIEAILHGLWDADNPFPNSGFLLLLRTATPSWKAAILKSIGAPTHPRVSLDLVSAALGTAMARPRNQFGMLVPNDDDQEATEIPYSLEFPFDPLDYDDGNAWIECRMRDKKTRNLLVVTGWSLKRREEDGAWTVDSVTWHDLRDEYRPGIGQSEWTRICG